MFDNTKVQEISIIKPAERVEGCEMISISLKDDEKSESKVLEIEFKQKSTGAKLIHKEFDPTNKYEGDKLNLMVGAFTSRTRHILNRYISNEESEIKAGTFLEYCQQFGKKLNGKYKGIECALKVTLNGKYAGLPMYPNFISTEFKFTEFKTDPKYDKYVIEDESNNAVGGISSETEEASFSNESSEDVF